MQNTTKSSKNKMRVPNISLILENIVASSALLNTFGLKLKQSGIHYQAISLVGDPREEIEKEIMMLEPSVVIMGNRGRGVVARTFLGSVSDHVLHHSSFPVMIIPFKKE